jgi:hypothetical protein
MSYKRFDLNIEEILEHWDVSHAIREVIANALDEQFLTKTRDIEIFKDKDGVWHIRDYGRGIRYEHLTQKENYEKLNNPYIIGKFGIGLKDALATFYRRGVKVFIKSKFGDITIDKLQKQGFEDIITIHAIIYPPSDPNFVGTEFILENVNDEDIEKAKDFFLKFSGEDIIERTEYGEVLKKKNRTARIYINGLKVAEEENFLFSYNITSLTRKIKQALNRERSNVGRGAYSDRVKSILLSCKSKEVAEYLVNDLMKFSTGEIHEELKWIDIQEHAVKILNATEKKVIFLTSEELIEEKNLVDEAISQGNKIVVIPDNLRKRISGKKDIAGNIIRDLNQFYKEYQESFEFKFVSPEELNQSEKEIFNKTDKILSLIGGKPPVVKEIKISETIRKEMGYSETVGLWDPETGYIIIRRDMLASLEKYAGTLLHEVIHAISGTEDASREFEIALTDVLGKIVAKVLEGDQQAPHV